MLASTVKPLPRYLLIVCALAGDSTITRAWPALPDFDLEVFRLAIRCESVKCAMFGKIRMFNLGYVLSVSGSRVVNFSLRATIPLPSVVATAAIAS